MAGARAGVGPEVQGPRSRPAPFEAELEAAAKDGSLPSLAPSWTPPIRRRQCASDDLGFRLTLRASSARPRRGAAVRGPRAPLSNQSRRRIAATGRPDSRSRSRRSRAAGSIAAPARHEGDPRGTPVPKPRQICISSGLPPRSRVASSDEPRRSRAPGASPPRKHDLFATVHVAQMPAEPGAAEGAAAIPKARAARDLQARR